MSVPGIAVRWLSALTAGCLLWVTAPTLAESGSDDINAIAKSTRPLLIAAADSLEQQCQDAVQGKVAWDQAGHTAWNDDNVRALCKGTTDPGATIVCFQAEIKAHNSWERGIAACAGKATAAAPNAQPAAAVTGETELQPAPVAPAAPAATATATAANTGTRICEEKDYVRESDKYLGDVCYKQSEGRGVGKIPSACPDGTDSEGGLCYPKCRSGYHGAVTMCVPECPSGFRDDGLYCAKGEPYGRGAGYPWKFGDALNDNGMIARCEADNGKGNCEKNGLIFYPKCKSGYVAMGANICSPQCPEGMTDIGVSCQKHTYDRGVGAIPDCPAGQVYDAGLCYPACAAGNTGIGPVCWADKCPDKFPIKCGAMCARNEDQCAKVTTTMVTSPLKAIASTIGVVLTEGASGAATAAVENAEREAYKQLRIKNITAQLKQRAKNESHCELSDGAALMAAQGLEALEHYQGTTDVMARLDPTSISTIVDAYAKPVCDK